MIHNLNKNFKLLRKKLVITQKQMAEFLGVSRNKVSRFECGLNALPITLLERACTLFGVSIHSLTTSTKPLSPLSNSWKGRTISKDFLMDIANINRIALNLIEMNGIKKANL